ncbi:hypothetical protein PIB30_107023 [Stylosanthes scabra]|uniref:Uncharacterized protein n=1 Tax=Stylosanthes scabra TaxID=79078 RepID=A0ABU6UZC9_9FABA|nr:hypothetical protein [Stylosanthes scabra]
MTFLFLACKLKSSWLNSLRKRCSSKTDMGAKDEAIREMNQGCPTPNLKDCLSPSNVDSENVGKKSRRRQGLFGRGQGWFRHVWVVQKGLLGVGSGGGLEVSESVFELLKYVWRELEAWRKRVCRLGSMPRREMPRLSVAGFGQGWVLVKGGRLGVEVARQA